MARAAYLKSKPEPPPPSPVLNKEERDKRERELTAFYRKHLAQFAATRRVYFN